MKAPAISIIVPVYNTAEYLHRCIDSILLQMFDDFEVLLVDDGSTDDSAVICDEYAIKDKRVKVFHKSNGGVTSARRKGVEEASGTWISFVDSDDELPFEALYILSKNINDDIDLIVSDYHEQRLITPDDFVRMTLCARLYSSIWGRLYRKSAIVGQMDNIPERISIGEDTILNIRIGCNLKRSVLLIPQKVYKYYENPTSAMRTRMVSLEYEDYFLQELQKGLNGRFDDFKDEFYISSLNSLELLVVCRIPVPYKLERVMDIIKWGKSTRMRLTLRQWLVLNIRNNILCRYLLALERRIKIILK